MGREKTVCAFDYILMKRIPLKFLAAAVAVCLACLAYGFLIEPRLLKLRYVTVKADVAQPLKIGLFGDIHIGGLHVPPARVEKIVQLMNAQNPDIILMTGDYINGHKARSSHREKFNQRADKGLVALSALTAPMGVYAAMGNHDAWYGQSNLRAALSGGGAAVLVNEAVNQDGICIVGLADADTDTEDAGTFNLCDPGNTVLAIMHSPDSFKYLRSDTALAVAGHTHGGQINLPIIGRAVTATQLGKPFAYGLRDWRGTAVYITAGIGTSILPARFRAPPEIVIIELVP